MIVLFRNSSDPSDGVAAASKARRDSNGSTPETAPASGLYADIENLQNRGQRVILNLAENWPPTAPPLKSLTLYVRADTTELWRAWATSAFPNLDVVVSGIQHFTRDVSKNSADIAITANAMADWLIGRISHVAVISDDSDFISLYAAMRQELERRGEPAADVPFLWIVTDRQRTVSEVARQFFPKDKLHVVSTSEPEPPAPVSKPEPAPTPAPVSKPEPAPAPLTLSDYPTMNDIAVAIIRRMQVGPFRSTDCQPIIRQLWPSHPLAAADGPAYGTDFKNSVWPILQNYGVRIPNSSAQPVRYEMTDVAKARVNR